jgi:hypothetical protein
MYCTSSSSLCGVGGMVEYKFQTHLGWRIMAVYPNGLYIGFS